MSAPYRFDVALSYATEDRDYVKQVAMELVGRADPRGASDYNMTLGWQRADAVARYVENHGLARARVQATSRGAADDTGMQSAATTDAPGASWNTPTATALCSVSGGTPAPCTVSGTGPPVNTVYYVQVIVTGSFATLIKYPGLPSKIPVSGTSVMRVVNQ